MRGRSRATLLFGALPAVLAVAFLVAWMLVGAPPVGDSATAVWLCALLAIGAVDQNGGPFRPGAGEQTGTERSQPAPAERGSLDPALLESAGLALLATDEAGIVRLFSGGASRMLGYAAAEVLGRATLATFFDPTQIARRAEEFSHALGIPLPQEGDVFLARARAGLTDQDEWTAVCKDGSRIPVLLSVTTLLEHDGQPHGFLAVAVDFTRQNEREREKSELLSTVSHELRAPLTSIRGALGLLEGGIAGVLSPEAANLVRMGRTNTDRLIRLINDLLDIDRVKSGRLALQLQEFAPHELVAETLEGLEGLAVEAGVTFTHSVATAARALADKDRVVQVLVNLVTNATRFSPRGATVRVEVTQASPSRLRFAVVDQGPGIPAQQLPLLFKRFQQLDVQGAPQKSGSGLGLAISKAIVERHGGAIGVDSEVGRGSTFWFELPSAVQARPAGPASEAGGTPLVLVEDDEDFSQLLRRLLAADGYAVTPAGTLSDARQVLALQVPAAILLDVRLPDGNGLEFAEWLQQSERLRGVPMVVLSAVDAAPERTGPPVVVDWLQKPSDEERMRAVLRRLVGERRVPRVLVVGEDAAFRRALVERLAVLHAQLLEANDPAEAIRFAQAQAQAPDLVLLDVAMRWPKEASPLDVLANKGRLVPVLAYSSTQPSQAPADGTRRLTKAQAAGPEFLAEVRALLGGLRRRTTATASA